MFDFEYRRAIHAADGGTVLHWLQDHALLALRERFGNAPLPASFVAAGSVPPAAHLAMQAVLQPYVDNAISKTINVAPDIDYAALRSIYTRAWQFGLKSCTAYRPNMLRAVLSHEAVDGEGSHCCGLEREMD